ncbi:TPA: phage virion morphogenesis protein [Escherichia coli]|nr:phage virion morphogenesis protein [Escherichia coli]
MGVSVRVSGTEKLLRIHSAILKLADASLKTEMLDSIGAVVESQTRRRITREKTAPDGSPWPGWSDSYAKTRHGNQSLLQGGGDLLDSIQFVVERGKVFVGSPLEYAEVHQNGFNESVAIGAHNRLITQAFGRALQHPVWQTVGAHNRKMNIPQREYLGISAANRSELLNVICDFMSEAIK